MPNILRNIKISEVSSVDKGAGEDCRVVLRKRDEERVMRTVTRRQLSDAMRLVIRKADDAGYSRMMAIAKGLAQPGESDASAFARCYTGSNPRLPDGNLLLSEHLAKRTGAGGNPQIYGGPSHADLPVADVDEDGDVDDEDQPDYHHDHGKPKIVRRKKMSGRGSNLNTRGSSLMHCDDDDEDEDNLHRERKKGFSRARRPAVEDEDDSGGLGHDTNAHRFMGVVDRVARARNIPKSKAIDQVLAEGGEGRAYYDRDMAKARAANAMNRV